jgi:co-chaperonin GroES (HSP10)
MKKENDKPMNHGWPGDQINMVNGNSVVSPVIDWEPAPGFLLCKALKREELAALYGRGGAGKLGLPDKVGKVSDSVGVGQVIKLGGYSMEVLLKAAQVADLSKDAISKKLGQKAYDRVMSQHVEDQVKPGDYIAWMPYTDQIIEIDGAKYSLVGYDKIRAVRKGGDANKA